MVPIWGLFPTATLGSEIDEHNWYKKSFFSELNVKYKLKLTNTLSYYNGIWHHHKYNGMVQACVPEAFVETIELLVLVDIQCIWINWAAYNLQNKNEKHVYECYCILSQEWCVLMKYINWFVLIQYCKRCQFYLFLCVLFKVKARSSWPQFWFLLPPLYIMRGP